MKTRMSKHKKRIFQVAGFTLGWLLLTAISPVTIAAPGDIQYERHSNDSDDATSELQSFPPAIFPHWIHRINYRCDACHDSLFEMKKGATPVTMEMINKGQACGTCHNGAIAFGGDYTYCVRCHTLPAE